MKTNKSNKSQFGVTFFLFVLQTFMKTISKGMRSAFIFMSYRPYVAENKETERDLKISENEQKS